MADRKLGELIDDLQQIREERRDLSAQDKALSAQYKETEKLVIEELNRIGLDKASGTLASASLSETEVPAVKDWTKLMRFIKKNGALHLFERRLAKSSWIEEVEARNGRDLPGVEAFTKVGLNLTTR